MPKPARHSLIWSAEREVYVAYEEQQKHALHLRYNDQVWFDWLASHTSFSFQGRGGHLNLLKETRLHGGEGYWYAYVRQGKGRIKQYAGRTSHLTFAHLEHLADVERLRSHRVPQIREARRLLQDEIVLEPLLISQLHAPRLASPLIEREDLLSALDDGLERKLTLLSAPAGFGKTTLLAQWVKRQKQRVAWLSLHDEHNDPLCFLYYLIGSLQSEIMALRLFYTISFGDFSLAIASCRQALQHLPIESHYLRGLILLLLGLAYTRSIEVSAAARALAEANSNIQAHSCCRMS